MDPNTQPQPIPEVGHVETAVSGLVPNAERANVAAGVEHKPQSGGQPATNQTPTTAVAHDPSAKLPASADVVVSPQFADDVDVIEKEWVDAADKLIAQTKEDPFAEEEAEEKLQIDYLKKRYGIDVKKP